MMHRLEAIFRETLATGPQSLEGEGGSVEWWEGKAGGFLTGRLVLFLIPFPMAQPMSHFGQVLLA